METIPTKRRVHGDKGVYYSGSWVDLEDLGKEWNPPNQVYSGDAKQAPPQPENDGFDCDVVVIGAGCIGAAIARELSRHRVRVVLLEGSDDVTQGATKGNSGIVHAGFDDTPGSVRAKLCWKGNQMFTQLDKELRFGLQRNGSLVVARGKEDEEVLKELLARGETNGVKRLRIVKQAELRAMEPAIAPDATAALFAPDAGTLTPYEYTIALAENAVDNGVELRLNRYVSAITALAGGGFTLTAIHKPVRKSGGVQWKGAVAIVVGALGAALAVFYLASLGPLHPLYPLIASLDRLFSEYTGVTLVAVVQTQATLLPVTTAALVVCVIAAIAAANAGSAGVAAAVVRETLTARYVVNAAGIGSDAIAGMVGDKSFYIKPRIGEYLLLHKKEGIKAHHILFPAPGEMGKGVLVQTTLWGNLILGPTAADVSDPTTATRTVKDIMVAILARCKDLVPSFDAGEVIHSFSGMRAKSSRGDWIIERCATAPDMIHAAGIDSPGLAGSPAIALEVIRLLKSAGLRAAANPAFNPNRRPIIVPKDHVRLEACTVAADGSVRRTKMGVDKQGAGCNIVCRCEKVLESEIVDAIHRSLPCGSTQAVRKRTRAGMGHCQGQRCEALVRGLIAREGAGVKAEDVPGRPWPATSILPQRYMYVDEEGQGQQQKAAIRALTG